MRVAVAYQDGEIYGHFGHCPMFAVYEYGEYVSDCTKKLVDSSDRSGHQQMADLMKELDVDAVIVGNMGGEGKAALLSYGIVPIVGYSGDADTASDLLVTGQLPTSAADGGCGGCSGLHMTYAATLRAKGQQVADCFARIGGMEVSPLPTLGMEDPFHYRN